MAMSRRAHSALQQGPRLLSRLALSILLLYAAMFRAPRSCSKSLSASMDSYFEIQFSCYIVKFICITIIDYHKK